MQEMAWLLTLVLIGVLAVIFFVFIAGTEGNDSYEEVAKKDYAWRGKLFWLAIIAGVIITGATLLPWPHAATADSSNVKIVQAIGSQWQWELSEQQFNAGQPIEFQVTSKDVNHGFAIYDSSMTMLAQVQAMPGYTNSLHYTFAKPGEYKILCMEYCGVAHHNMIASLTVLPAKN
ncbi:MAG: cytochrome c oxidase subunit II [Thioalkalispiraceae bacterium]|jgi:cytochrome c oxidase subunit 2